LGQIYEADKKNDQAISNLKKAIELEPNNIDYLSHLGRVYFNMGVEKRAESDEISDVNKSKAVLQESHNYFRESMPFFEKVFNLDSKNTGAVFALRSIYYSLNMSEYEKMDALYNSMQGQ